MATFLLKRMAQSLLIMLCISMVSFAVQDQLGDPLRELVGQSVTPLERQELRRQMGLNDPFLTQYGRFLVNALRGDLGTSYFFHKPVTEVILGKLPATLELVLAASLIIICFSFPAGIFAALRPRSRMSKIIMGFSIIGISFPVFITALGLIYLFSVHLNWLPSFGRGETTTLGFWETNYLTLDGLKHLILPAITLSSVMLPLFIRLIRAEMLEVLQSEYVRFAKAKGMSKAVIYCKHALKNTLLPVITVGGVQLGIMIAYTILTETVFQWPGMGFMFLEAVNRSDIPLLTAYLMFVGLVFIVVNTLVDIVYGLINPTTSVFER